MEVYVVATTDEGTRAALHAARSFAAGLQPHITLLVAHVVPYPEPLDCATVSLAFTTARFQSLVADVGADLSIRICVCRPGDLSFEPAVPDDGVVMVGGVRGMWRRSRERRLADRLAQIRSRVLFVATDGRSQSDNRTRAR